LSHAQGYVKIVKWQESGRQNSMCFAAQGRLKGWAAKLLLARWQSWCYGRCLAANGPAIKGGCVARRLSW